MQTLAPPPFSSRPAIGAADTVTASVLLPWLRMSRGRQARWLALWAVLRCMVRGAQSRLVAVVAVAVLAGGLVAGCVTAGAAGGGTSEAAGQPSAEALRLAQTRVQLGTMYFHDGRFDVALGEVAQALHVHPRYADAYNLQGWIYLGLRDFAQADASFAQAMTLQPGDPDTLYNQGWSLCQQKRFDEAIPLFDAAVATPRYAEESKSRALMAKGACQRDAGHLDAAVQTLARAYEINPGNPAIAYNYASALYAQADYVRARFYLRRLNSSALANAASLWLGIRTERKLGDFAAMRQWAEQLKKRFPHAQESLKYEQGAFDE